jgi:hypothetical protein
MSERDAPDLNNSREWIKKDEHNDRSVSEGPVSGAHWAQRSDKQVDAVPGCRWRPGSTQ